MRMLRTLVVAVAAIAATVTSFPSSAEAQAKYKWRMATWEREGSETFNLFAKRYAEVASLLTNGEVEITPFGAGVLGPMAEGYKSVKDGVADIAWMWAGFIVNQDPANSMIASFPGGMGPEAMLHWMYDGGGLQLLTEFRRNELGLHPVVAGILTSELFAHSHKAIRTADDLKGVKFRTAGAYAEILKALGATPAVIPGPDVFPMLERKAIDATEYLTPYLNSKIGFQKVARYIVYPGIHSPSSMYEVVFKKETWDALPQPIRTKLELAGKIVTLESFTYLGHRDMVAMQELRAGRNEFSEIDQALIKQIRSASRDWAKARAAEQSQKGNEWMKRLSESYFSYQDSWAKNSAHRVTDRE